MIGLAEQHVYSVFCGFYHCEVNFQSSLFYITKFSLTSIFYCLAYGGCNIKLAFTILFRSDWTAITLPQEMEKMNKLHVKCSSTVKTDLDCLFSIINTVYSFH